MDVISPIKRNRRSGIVSLRKLRIGSEIDFLSAHRGKQARFSSILGPCLSDLLSDYFDNNSQFKATADEAALLLMFHQSF